MSQKSVTFYPGKKQDSYPEDAIRLTKTALGKHVKKQMTLIFPSIKVPKVRLRQKLINKLAKTIKLILEYDDGNLEQPITIKNIKDGVFDDFISLSLPEVMPERISSLKMVLDDSYIHFTLE